jgi:adenylate cyclase
VAARRRLAAIVFTDLAGYTSLTHADEAGALRTLEAQDRLVRPLLAAHRGRKVKSMGDGLLVEFANARDAVEFAVNLQRASHDHNAREGGRPVRIRVGVHIGDVERRGGDILGDAVNIASRIEPLAETGGVALTAQVYDQVHNKVAYQIEKLGPRRLKGVPDPVDVYRVALPWMAEPTDAKAALLPRVAVLPLANISPDPNDEFFAAGLTEEMISVLSQVGGLRVIARTSVAQYKDSTKPISQIGSELGVVSVLEGSVRKAGDRLRITVQLIDVRTEEHQWAQTFDRQLDNVFAIQAEVAEQTAGALKVHLLRSERESLRTPPTTSTDAYQSYLRGIEAERRMAGMESTGAEIQRVGQFFEEAVRLDPRFSLAHSRLALIVSQQFGVVAPRQQLLPRFRALVAKALALDPHSSEAHRAKAVELLWNDLDWSRGEGELLEAIALSPSNTDARSDLGGLYRVQQRFPEAKKQLLAAIQLDPLHPEPRQQLQVLYQDQGDEESARVELERLGDATGRGQYYWEEVAWREAAAGRAAETLAALNQVAEANPPQYVRRRRAWVLALLGRDEELRGYVSDWENGRLGEYESTFDLARSYAMLGKVEEAIRFLERDCNEGYNALLWNYRTMSLDPVRHDPRFVALLRHLKLPTTLARPVRAYVRSSRD